MVSLNEERSDTLSLGSAWRGLIASRRDNRAANNPIYIVGWKLTLDAALDDSLCFSHELLLQLDILS